MTTGTAERSAVPVAARPLASRTVRARSKPPISLLVGGFVASALVALPIFYIGVRATERGWDQVVRTAWRHRTFELILNTVALALVVAGAATVIGVGAAWLVASTNLPGRRFLQVAFATPLALPSYAAGWAWISWRPDLAGFWGAALVLVSISYPYVYLPVLGALRGVDPVLAEVARACGRRPFAVFWGVTLRQVRPAVVAGVLLVALYVMSEFGAVATMRFETLTQVIYQSYRSSYDRTPAAVLGCVLVLVAAVPLALAMRWGSAGRVDRAGPGVTRRQAPLQLGWAAVPAWAAAGGLLVVVFGIPGWNLVRWMSIGTSVTAWDDFRQALVSTLWVSTLAAGATVVVALPVAVLAARHRGRLSDIAVWTAYAGHGLPGVVVALSLVFFGIRYAGPLYQRTPMLIAAYVVMFLSLAIGAIQASVAQSSPSLGHVAASLGDRPVSVWRRVTLPLALPGIGAAATLVFIAVAKELPATLLLRPIGTETLATSLWERTDAQQYAAAAPFAAALVTVAVVPTLLLTRARKVGT